MMSFWVVIWSAALPVIALVNMVAWGMAAVVLRRRRHLLVMHVLEFRRLQLVLSAGYVFGCAFRSVLPVFDVPRVALVNSLLSTAAVGRSVATIAELCFIAQWALLLRETSRATGSVVGRFAARVVIPMIVVAEICSWYSVLTTSNLGHVFEESLWTLATAVIVASLLANWHRWDIRWRSASVWLATAGIGYLLYLLLVDVPMYWSRWLAEQASGKAYLSLGQGFLSATGPPVVSYAWDVWKSELAWMAAYFSVAVWVSIWLVHAPVPSARQSLQHQRRRTPFVIPGFGVLVWRRVRS